jgi:glutathione S-transferase
VILIGMYDSSYTRRVAIAMALYGLAFEHRAWSVGRDFDRIREYNPLGRAPTLVLDDGEVLTESSMMLDYLDDTVGPDRALIPTTGRARRDALRLVALATGAIDKAILIALERVFRPVEQHSQAWLTRCRVQVEGALGELEQACAARGDAPWLVGEAMTHADIAVACYTTHLREAIPLDLAPWPALRAHVDRCEAMDVFRSHYSPFSAPTPQAASA